MSGTGLGLTAVPTAPGLIDALAVRHPRLGLDGLLARRGRRATSGRPRVVHGTRRLRWRWDDQASTRWWPQGVDVQRRAGRTIAVVSWFAQRRRGSTPGARLTFVDLDARHPRYHHVTLVAPVDDGHGGVRMDPVAVHAGGVAWSGDRIFVAATRGGLREFRLRDLLDTDRGMLRAGAGPAGARAVLPQHAALRATSARGVEQLRYSFVSLESAESAPALVVGEYTGGAGTRRLVRIPIADGGPALDADRRAAVAEVHDPGILRMQGALVVDGRWFVSSSNGDRDPGDLWTGTEPGGLVRLRHALEVGPEDLAVNRQTGELLTVTEFPWRRSLLALDLAALRDAAESLGPDAERPRPPA